MQRTNGDRISENILWSRVSAVRSQVQVFRCRYRFWPVPVPEPEDPYLIPD